MYRRKLSIMIAEDDLADINLIQSLLEKSPYLEKIEIVRNGQELMDNLNLKKYDSSLHPDLILLDLNMPKKNGRQVLSEMKIDPQFKKIPVIVFTSSGDEKDILDCYTLHANSYIRKPIDLNDMNDTLQYIEDYWFKTVSLPSDRMN